MNNFEYNHIHYDNVSVLTYLSLYHPKNRVGVFRYSYPYEYILGFRLRLIGREI